MNALANTQCKPCTEKTVTVSQEEVDNLLRQLDSWTQNGCTIEKTFEFHNYYQTMAFVNMVAWLSHREDHHPDMKVTYKSCHVAYTTHVINGLSENDFICAAKIDALLKI